LKIPTANEFFFKLFLCSSFHKGLDDYFFTENFKIDKNNPVTFYYVHFLQMQVKMGLILTSSIPINIGTTGSGLCYCVFGTR